MSRRRPRVFRPVSPVRKGSIDAATILRRCSRAVYAKARGIKCQPKARSCLGTTLRLKFKVPRNPPSDCPLKVWSSPRPQRTLHDTSFQPPLLLFRRIKAFQQKLGNPLPRRCAPQRFPTGSIASIPHPSVVLDEATATVKYEIRLFGVGLMAPSIFLSCEDDHVCVQPLTKDGGISDWVLVDSGLSS